MKKSMKNFLARKWHRLPVGIVAALAVMALTVGSVFAAYNFLSFTTEIVVDEPLAVEASWWDYNEDEWTEYWEVTGTGDELTLTMSPGETQTLDLRVYNISYAPLTVHTVMTGAVGQFTFNGFPNGVIPGSNGDNSLYEWSGNVTITCDGDAPPGTYSVGFAFTRE